MKHEKHKTTLENENKHNDEKRKTKKIGKTQKTISENGKWKRINENWKTKNY